MTEIDQLRQRVRELEAENATLRQQLAADHTVMVGCINDAIVHATYPPAPDAPAVHRFGYLRPVDGRGTGI